MIDKINYENFQIIFDWLKKTYPNTKTALDHKDAFQLLIATILAAQCTDERVNKATAELFKKYPNADKLADAKIENIEEEIKSINFFRNKAKFIKQTALIIKNEHGGQVPKTIESLVKMPGVARKTASVVLGNSFNINEGIPVDTHVTRLSQRLKLTLNSTPEKIEQDLMKIIPQIEWTETSLRLIDHGRAICHARKPDCLNCGLLDVCPAGKEFVL